MIRLENILKIFLQEVLKTPWKCLENVFARRLENFFKTSWKLIAMTNILVLTKTSWRNLEGVFRRSITKANIFVLIKTSWWRLLKTKTKDVFKTSSKRLHQEECLVGINHSIDFLNEFVLGINNQNLPFQTYRKSVYTGLLLNFASFT